MMTAFPDFRQLRDTIRRSAFARQLDQDGFDHLEKGKKYLVALSGGPDSVALTLMLWAKGMDIGCAHVNYHLRGEESNDDEAFCKDFCVKLGIKLHVRSAKLEEAQLASNKSRQEIARDARYAFFTGTLEHSGYDHIVTAHHLDDSIETFFINLLRGTGIEGLTGIPARRGVILRPFLRVRKEQILLFLDRYRIPYRSDRSNESLAYQRNRIRHELIPLITGMKESFPAIMARNMERLRAFNDWLDQEVEKWKMDYFTQIGDHDVFSGKGFTKNTPLILIYTLFKPYGIRWSEVHKLKEMILGQPGKRMFSKTHEILVDRQQVIVREKVGSIRFRPVEINPEEIPEKRIITLPSGTIELRLAEHVATEQLAGSHNTFCISVHDISPPLIFRLWEPGDRIQPAGMKGKHQKVSALLTNEKITRLEKEITCIVADQERTLWVVGHRKAMGTGCTDRTGHALLMTYHPSKPGRGSA